MSDEHNHTHDHDHEHDVVVLTDDEGVDHEFVIVDVLEVESKNYAILVPHENPEGDAVILRIEADENEEEYLIDIESDEEWQKVVSAYERLAESQE